MRLEAVDLNLLVALDALLAEHSVTRAARRVGLSQPAMSHALGRLRELLGDPLLLRAGSGMVATSRGRSLAEPVRALLQGIERALEPPAPFDPAASTASFTLSLEEPGQVGMLPRLVDRLRRGAPGVTLTVLPRAEGDQWRALESGEIDLAFAVSPGDAPGFHGEHVFRIPYVSLVRRDHPVVKRRLTLKRFLELGHITVSRPGIADPDLDRLLAERGLSRRVALRVPSLLPVPWLVAGSDFVATVPGMLGNLSPTALPIRACAPPVPIEPLSVSLVWHERTHRDPAHRWLRDVVREVCAEVG